MKWNLLLLFYLLDLQYRKEGSYNLVAARKSFPQGVTGGAPGVNQLCSSPPGRLFSHSRTREANGLDGWLWLPMAASSPRHSRPTFHLACDLWPVAKMGMGGGRERRSCQAAWAQATDERIQLFALLTLTWQVLDAAELIGLQIRLLTGLCRQAVTPVVPVYVCRVGGAWLQSQLCHGLAPGPCPQDHRFSHLWNGAVGSPQVLRPGGCWGRKIIAILKSSSSCPLSQ